MATVPENSIGARIVAVEPHSPAERSGVRIGDVLLRVNGNAVTDVLDYKFYTYDARLLLELRRGDRAIFARVRKRDGDDLGLEFETYLMSRERSCSNRCVFCFIDQLPRGMRPTLYYKDDDARLSFLQGNYITLTNLSEREIQRVIDLRISPLNVSVHTMNPELRAKMLGNPRGADTVDTIRHLARSGLTLNCQIVVCPEWNDGAELAYSMRELAALYPNVASVSVVPVGLTRYRDGLEPLTPFNAESALQTVREVEAFAETCLREHGSRIFYCADELYIKAGLDFPRDEDYEDYPQLENGVGMARLLITEFEDALSDAPEPQNVPFTAVTGRSAAEIINNLLETLNARAEYDTISQNSNVLAVRNDFFGETVDVAGLVTGGDIIRTLTETPPRGRILLPRNMLRHGETVFLDDVPVSQLTALFGVPVRIVEQDGADLLSAMIGM
ncbi:MAG: DUF512 domain-containing protein [Oscillospiraceae bacterium]|jgi:putative radical SAM enzyme (TIGR03279 family)|nr:DUF512 domain-containing protein [Oscillospiraceae bacterium]